MPDDSELKEPRLWSDSRVWGVGYPPFPAYSCRFTTCLVRKPGTLDSSSHEYSIIMGPKNPCLIIKAHKIKVSRYLELESLIGFEVGVSTLEGLGAEEALK